MNSASQNQTGVSSLGARRTARLTTWCKCCRMAGLHHRVNVAKCEVSLQRSNCQSISVLLTPRLHPPRRSSPRPPLDSSIRCSMRHRSIAPSGGWPLVDDKGQLLYGRNADKLFIPASNTKLVVTTVAAALLPPEWTVRDQRVRRGPGGRRRAAAATWSSTAGAIPPWAAAVTRPTPPSPASATTTPSPGSRQLAREPEGPRGAGHPG